MKSQNQSFQAHGKLLLAGEYFVLDGATAFAVPTRLGQSLNIQTTPSETSTIQWEGFDYQGNIWIEALFAGADFQVVHSSSHPVSTRLREIFLAAQRLDGIFPQGRITAQTQLDFPRDWGLGSSSTLIYSLAKWLRVPPFQLLKKTFGGSGYDLACAQSETAIFYTLKEQIPTWNPVLFSPPFQENIGFVYLGHKQNSREGIRIYRQKGLPPQSLIQEVSYLAKALSHQDTLVEFIKIIEKLEEITGHWIQSTPIKSAKFADFQGAIKSLGAWGGDFALAVSPQGHDYMKAYFQKNDLDIFFRFDQMLLPA